MNEHSLWVWLRDTALPEGHYSRIESPDTAPGFPDVHYTLPGKSTGTLELKYARHRNPPFPNEDAGLHRSQLRWIRDELACGGTVWIIAEVQYGSILLIPGCYAEEFNGAPRHVLELNAEAVLHRSEPESAAALLEEFLHV